MKFLNREIEMQRLVKALASRKPRLIIIYGRRRCGKSTLIKNILKPDDIYFVAQQNDEAIQRMQLANTIGERIKGFDSVIYPDWESLFTNLDNTVKKHLTICLDEFPYLVKSSSNLPSLIQKIVDNNKRRKYHLIICGSSQNMVRGFFFDSSSPLYGRADEIMKITPLGAGWIGDALGCEAQQSVVEYSVWGGVPRYWELRSDEKSFKSAVKNIILDGFGPLHEEPIRLFIDDMRESVQAYSILSVIGNGSNRLSEIAGRLNKPATNLSRPIENLIQLGYIKRDLPFGEPEKNSKKGIYRISDPLMNFYFTFLAPNLSRLELGLTDLVFNSFESRIQGYVSSEWENICRQSIPMQPINGINFDIAGRWWGSNIKKEPVELDIVSESVNKEYLLIGECKWSKINDCSAILYQLKQKAVLLPFAKGKKVITILFAKDTPVKNITSQIFLPADVLNRLR